MSKRVGIRPWHETSTLSPFGKVALMPKKEKAAPSSNLPLLGMQQQQPTEMDPNQQPQNFVPAIPMPMPQQPQQPQQPMPMPQQPMPMPGPLYPQTYPPFAPAMPMPQPMQPQPQQPQPMPMPMPQQPGPYYPQYVVPQPMPQPQPLQPMPQPMPMPQQPQQPQQQPQQPQQQPPAGEKRARPKAEKTPIQIYNEARKDLDLDEEIFRLVTEEWKVVYNPDNPTDDSWATTVRTKSEEYMASVAQEENAYFLQLYGEDASNAQKEVAKRTKEYKEKFGFKKLVVASMSGRKFTDFQVKVRRMLSDPNYMTPKREFVSDLKAEKDAYEAELNAKKQKEKNAKEEAKTQERQEKAQQEKADRLKAEFDKQASKVENDFRKILNKAADDKEVYSMLQTIWTKFNLDSALPTFEAEFDTKLENLKNGIKYDKDMFFKSVEVRNAFGSPPYDDSMLTLIMASPLYKNQRFEEMEKAVKMMEGKKPKFVNAYEGILAEVKFKESDYDAIKKIYDEFVAAKNNSNLPGMQLALSNAKKAAADQETAATNRATKRREEKQRAEQDAKVAKEAERLQKAEASKAAQQAKADEREANRVAKLQKEQQEKEAKAAKAELKQGERLDDKVQLLLDQLKDVVQFSKNLLKIVTEQWGVDLTKDDWKQTYDAKLEEYTSMLSDEDKEKKINKELAIKAFRDNRLPKLKDAIQLRQTALATVLALYNDYRDAKKENDFLEMQNLQKKMDEVNVQLKQDIASLFGTEKGSEKGRLPNQAAFSLLYPIRFVKVAKDEKEKEEGKEKEKEEKEEKEEEEEEEDAQRKASEEEEKKHEEDYNKWLKLKKANQEEEAAFILDNRDRLPSFPDTTGENDTPEKKAQRKRTWTTVQTRLLKHMFRAEKGLDFEAEDQLRQETYRTNPDFDVFDEAKWDQYKVKMNTGTEKITLEPDEAENKAIISEFEREYEEQTRRAEQQAEEREQRATKRYAKKLAAALKNNTELPDRDKQYDENLTEEEKEEEKKEEEAKAKAEKEEEEKQEVEKVKMRLASGRDILVPKFDTRMSAARANILYEVRDAIIEQDPGQESDEDKKREQTKNDFVNVRKLKQVATRENKLDDIEKYTAEEAYMSQMYKPYALELEKREPFSVDPNILDDQGRPTNQMLKDIKEVNSFWQDYRASEKRKRDRLDSIRKKKKERKNRLKSKRNAGDKRRNTEFNRREDMADDKDKAKFDKQRKKERINRKKKKRMEGLPKSLFERVTKSSESQNKISVALAIRDLEQEKFQAAFDMKMASVMESKPNKLDPTPDMFPWEVELDPKFQVPIVSPKTRLSTSGVGGRIPEEMGIDLRKDPDWKDTWPITEMVFTQQQLNLLFVRKSIAMPSEDDMEDEDVNQDADDDGGNDDDDGFQGDNDDDRAPKSARPDLLIPPSPTTSPDRSPMDYTAKAGDKRPRMTKEERAAKKAEKEAADKEKKEEDTRQKRIDRQTGRRDKKKLEESRRDLLQRLNEDEIVDADYLLFHKPYAKCLIAEHLISLKKQHVWTFGYLTQEQKDANAKAAKSKTSNQNLIGNPDPNPSVRFVDVAGALGPITKDDPDGKPNPFSDIDGERLSNVVNELLPAFESMLRYRNTSLKVKETEIMNEIRILGEGGQKTSLTRDNLKKTLEQIQKMEVDEIWGKVDSKRMMQSEYGQLPGQLYTPQPYQLPLRVSAPPRVGKSATALLMASFAKRLGMVSLYSVYPNKLPPISEMSKKLHRLGWRGPLGMEEVKEEAIKAEKGRPKTAQDPGRDPVPNAQIREIKHTRMRFEWMTIDELIPTGTEDKTVFGTRGDVVDMVLYSSDQAADCMKAGAALSKWRRSSRVVFHIRDEAQGLAKELENKAVPSHNEFVPPPQGLQFLRYYYGNLFGLNCLVTATLFPVFLEEGLWGFFGSISQNARCNLPLSASVKQIQSTLGFNYLPKILPAIKPYVSPGYIGVDHMTTWTYPKDIEKRLFLDDKKKELELYYTVNGEKQQIYAFTPRKQGDEAFLQYGAAHKGIQVDGTSRSVESTFTFQQEQEFQKKARDKRKNGTQKVTQKQQDLDAKAEKEYQERAKAQLDGLKIDGGTDYALTGRRRSTRAAAQAASDAMAADAANSADAADAASSSSASSAAPDDANKKKKASTASDPLYTPMNNNTKFNAKYTATLLAQNHLNDDKLSIDLHFQDWLENANEDTVDKFAEDTQTIPPTNDMLVPMYLGALNNKVADEQMITFVEHFGTLAHSRVKKARLAYGSTPDDSLTPSSEYGVAFLVYQSVLKTRSKIEEATSNPKTGKPPLRFHDDTEIDNDDGVIEGQGWKPGEGASSTPAYVLTAFFYDPNEARNKSTNKESEMDEAPPAFRVIRFTNAESAIRSSHFDMKINRIAILGYNMLSAGLTIQSVIESPLDPSKVVARTRNEARKKIEEGTATYRRIYCASHLALASSDDASLDRQLQLGGRTFAELKEYEAPLGWKIQVLGVQGIVDTLTNYSQMEAVLADINTPKSLLDQRRRLRGGKDEDEDEEANDDTDDTKSVASEQSSATNTTSTATSTAASATASIPMVRTLTLAEALKESFDAILVSENQYGSLGKVGVRRGDFSGILGLTTDVAVQRAKAASAARKAALKLNIKNAKKIQELARRELATQIAKDEAAAAAAAAAAASSSSSPSSSSSSDSGSPPLDSPESDVLAAVIDVVDDRPEQDVEMKQLMDDPSVNPPLPLSKKTLGKKKAPFDENEYDSDGELVEKRDPKIAKARRAANNALTITANMKATLKAHPDLPRMIVECSFRKRQLIERILEGVW